jgi:hypothetical protein
VRTVNIATEGVNNAELLRLEEEKDLRKFPLDKLLFMFISYVAMLVISFLKGSEKMKSFIGIPVYL